MSNPAKSIAPPELVCKDRESACPDTRVDTNKEYAGQQASEDGAGMHLCTWFLLRCPDWYHRTRMLENCDMVGFTADADRRRGAGTAALVASIPSVWNACGIIKDCAYWASLLPQGEMVNSQVDRCPESGARC
ncbi:hypothetical protein GCM10023166_09450 [Paeniglutamicibacter cryotolerans]